MMSYGVGSQAIFSENACFFNFFRKKNLVAKIMQSAYLCVKHKEITISQGFNLISNSW